MRVLFVCTGNTCRSPTAEHLLRRELAERGVEGVTVGSAGVGAWDGSPASEGAYLIGLEHGLDLSAHRARLLTPELAAEYDLILTMGRSHLERVRELGAGDGAHLLTDFAGRGGRAGDVFDPYGGALEQYRTTHDELRELIARVADRLVAHRSGESR
jgi:protein-tyrosine phosphatase